MQETLEYIDDYFTQALDSEQKKAFELRCRQDEAFAKEVAFYLSARNAVRELLVEQKQKAAPESEITVKEPVKTMPAKKRTIRLWLPYAAAACILFIIATTFLFNSSTSQQMADAYVKENYTTLRQTMDGSHDSLQLGIAAYNNLEYQQALIYFEGVHQRNPASRYATKYAGLAYLQTKNYDKALERFKELSAVKNLYSNSGDFMQAITLIERNQPGDKNAATQLLQKVTDNQEEGSEKAKELLDKLK